MSVLIRTIYEYVSLLSKENKVIEKIKVANQLILSGKNVLNYLGEFDNITGFLKVEYSRKEYNPDKILILV